MKKQNLINVGCYAVKISFLRIFYFNFTKSFKKAMKGKKKNLISKY